MFLMMQRANPRSTSLAAADEAAAEIQKPARRTLRFESFDAIIADSRQLELGYEQVGNWTLGQACDHLAKFMRYSMEGFPGRALPWPFSAVMRRIALSPRRIVRPMPPGLRTPKFLMPATVGPARDLRQADHEAAARLVEMCRRVKHHGGEFYPSPLFGKLPPAMWRLVHLRHCELHLSFLVPSPMSRHEMRQG